MSGNRVHWFLGLAAAVSMTLTACGAGSGGPPPPPPTPPSSISIFPGTTTSPVNEVVLFTKFVIGSTNTAVTWEVNGVAGGNSTVGTIDANGVFTAPASIPTANNGVVSVTAVSQADNKTTSNTASVTITAAQSLVVSPAGVAVPAGATQSFSAKVNGQTVAASWAVAAPQGGDPGTIDASGNYTAPLSPPLGGSVIITATSAGNQGTARATVTFSNASLKGQYAFSYSGADGTGFVAVAGEFIADGNGHITSGVEDAVDLAAVTSQNPINSSSTYSVGPDGRTTANITTGSGSGIVWQFTLVSNKHALVIRFDQFATASGTIDLQDTSAFVPTAISGNYAFSLSGLDFNFGPFGIAGKFLSPGSTGAPFTNGVWDLVNSSTVLTDDTSLGGNFSLDPLNPGRGIITFTSARVATLQFGFYIVDKTHLKLVENDNTASLAGDAFSAPGGPFTTAVLKGNYAFTTGGTASSGNPSVIGPYGAGGVFITDGNGNVIGGIQDINNGAQGVHLQQQLHPTTYTVDQTLGRVDLFVKGNNTFEYAVYTTSSGSAVMLQLDSNVIEADGIAYHQSSTAQAQGNFAMNLTGVAVVKAGNFSQDATGAISTGPSGSLGGLVDFNNSGSPFPSLVLVNSNIVATDANGRGTSTLTFKSFPQFQIAYYVIDANTALLLEADTTRVMTGVIARQF